MMAALVWLPIGALLLLAGASDDDRGRALVIAGLPVSAAVGWILAPRAMTTQGLGFGTAIRFAFLAVLVGGLLWGVLFALISGQAADDAVSFAIIGWIFLGIPMVILGVNLALVWIAVLRRVLRAAGQVTLPDSE
jgi:hypothetical protein